MLQRKALNTPPQIMATLNRLTREHGQYGSEADDFEFEEVGSTMKITPMNTTTCDQQVNQAASASGGDGK